MRISTASSGSRSSRPASTSRSDSAPTSVPRQRASRPDLALAITGKGWVQSGQFVDMFNNGTELYHIWTSQTFMYSCVDATYRDRLRLSLGTEGTMWFNLPKQTGTGQATYVHQENSSIIVSDANASYRWGDLQSPFLCATIGLFPYKYDPQARNLGEYLFRSGTYPAYLINNFDSALRAPDRIENRQRPVRLAPSGPYLFHGSRSELTPKSRWASNEPVQFRGTVKFPFTAGIGMYTYD